LRGAIAAGSGQDGRASWVSFATVRLVVSGHDQHGRRKTMVIA